MTEYCAVIFDLMNSKTLANRSQVQQFLISSIRTYNADYSSRLASPFLIIMGDEWQGLLQSADDVQSTIEFFKCNLELPFYVGVGIGECTIFQQELTVNQLDGPAFYKAREALQLAKAGHYSEVIIH